MLDLFAGAGGMTAGLHAASERFTPVAAVEMDLAAAATFEKTFGRDIVAAMPIQDWLASDLVPDSVDVIVGGPPCQGFSTLGKQDVEDERNSLWEQYAKTILRVKPKYFVVENVAAFAKSPQFELFQAAVKDGELKDYDFQHAILNAADYGAPQARKRAVLIGHHRDLAFPGLPEPTHSADPEATGLLPHVTVRKALSRVPKSPDRDQAFLERGTEYAGKEYAGWFKPRDLHWSRDYTEDSLKRFRSIPAGGNRFDIPEELLAPCWVRHRSGSGDVMGRLHLDKPSVTIRTEFFKPEKGRYLHPTEHRAITHYEAAILQGFPTTHKFVGSKTAIARQIGNAVPIPLGAAIGRQLVATL